MKNALNGLFVVTVFALCAPSLSWACSPPIYPLEIGAAVGNPDGVAFTVIDDGWGGAITAELTLGGETIPGTTEAVRDTAYHIFRPAEPLAEGDYELSVSNENSSDGTVVSVGPKLDLNLETHVYDMGNYILACPTFDGEPVRLYDEENTFLKSGRLGLARWENDCIRWRTRIFECDPPLKQKPIRWSFFRTMAWESELQIVPEYDQDFRVLEPHERRVCDTAVVVDK